MPSPSTLIVHADQPTRQRIAPYLFAKFCEHLGHNIYQGMEAQIAINCTFAAWQFHGGECPINGGHRAQCDHQRILQQIRDAAPRHGYDADLAVASYQSALAFPWLRLGDATRYSADTGPFGGRAQRFELLQPGDSGGLWQSIALPLHRTRNYSVTLLARAADACIVRLSLTSDAGDELIGADLSVNEEWTTQSRELTLPDHLDPAARYRLQIAAHSNCNIVIARLTLYPGDAVDGLFDPEIIAFLREARLPLLRWPGGNFVSGYHWMDGVGPIDRRPTRPNPAWAGLEYNQFGTAEFIRYCRAVGCEPLICINAGDGTPAEAAQWVQYCNGSHDTPMGALRTAHGHPEPFNVRLWEIGNELWGRWQVHSTTPGGNVDRFRRFAAAMRAADPGIELLATGAQCTQDQEWTHTLLARGGVELRTLTDHILAWHPVSADADPMDLFQAYMAHAVDGARQYRWTRERMLERHIADPGMALTEMQLFPAWRDDPAKTGAMTPEKLVRPNTLAEAVYFFTWLCECVRLGDFVRMITHSAVVNHGGGLQKHRERTFAHPIHHAHVMLAPLQGAHVVPVKLSCPTYATGRAYGVIPAMDDVPVLEAIAAIDATGHLHVFIASRAREPITLSINLPGPTATEAELTTLAADAPWSRNTPAHPEHIRPITTHTIIRDGALTLTLTPSQLTRVTMKASR